MKGLKLRFPNENSTPKLAAIQSMLGIAVAKQIRQTAPVTQFNLKQLSKLKSIMVSIPKMFTPLVEQIGTIHSPHGLHLQLLPQAKCTTMLYKSIVSYLLYPDKDVRPEIAAALAQF